MLKDIDVIVGPPGCGKTELMMDEVLAKKTRHLWVTSRIDLIDERMNDFRRKAAVAGVRPRLVAVHGEACKPKTVDRAIADAAGELASEQHAVMSITHEGLMLADPALFQEWSVHIDELPPAVSSGCFRVPAGHALLAHMYDLEPMAGEWSRVVLRPGSPQIGNLMQDGVAGALTDFHARVRGQQGVFVNVTGWSELDGNKRALEWVSIWTPEALSGCAGVQIAGAGFFDSLLHHAIQKLAPHIRCQERRVARPRTGTPQVRVHYFAAGHRGSTKFWEAEPKRACLNAVCRYLAIVQPGYWSGNGLVRDYFRGWLAGEEIRPKAEGTNSLMHHTSCAYIYSAKVTPADRVLQRLFGWTDAVIERAREQEDILQFVARGALRRPEFDGTYDIYLYDRWQAGWLAGHLAKQGLAVELVPVEDAGIMDSKRLTAAVVEEPAASTMSAAEKEAAQKEHERQRGKSRRDRDKAERIANGTYQRPGRPKKAA